VAASRHGALRSELEKEKEASRSMAQVAAHEWSRNQEEQRRVAMAAKDFAIESPGYRGHTPGGHGKLGGSH